MSSKAEDGSSKAEKAKECRFKQNLQSLSDAENMLNKLVKLFGGLIPIQDAIKELRAKGIDEPERLVKKLLQKVGSTNQKRAF